METNQSDLVWGVWCEPVGHGNTPRWLYETPTTYDDAVSLSDDMNDSNHFWYYIPKRRDV